MARYTGIVHATGDYILFLDSDDTLKPSACKLLSRFIKKHKADIIQFGCEEMPGRHITYSRFYKSPYDRIQNYLAGNNRLSPELWTKAYSSAVLKQACKIMKPFYAIFAEDLYVSIIITYFSKTSCFLRKALVCYSKNTGISQKRTHSLETYQTWLLSYRTNVNKLRYLQKGRKDGKITRGREDKMEKKPVIHGGESLKQ
jgi:glycosyltransferase involved in cell wall biosynthesis